MLQQKIKKHKNVFSERSDKYKKIKLSSNSWFSLKEKKYDVIQKSKNKKFICEIPKEEKTKCKKIKIYPTEDQRNIIKIWMNTYITMYNEVIKFFKIKSYNNEKQILNWRYLRTNHMMDIKKKLIQTTQIYAHILDGAIQDACACFKSALTNLRRGHIKYFRLRYIKHTKSKKVLKLESQHFSKNSSTFCKSIFGNKISTKNNFDLSQIDRDCKLHYDTSSNEMILLIPTNSVKYDETIKKNKNEYISLDPGIRCFLTGYTESKDIKIGENLMSTITKHLNKIDRIKNKKHNISKKLKQKIEKKQYFKIKNKVDDMHWKTIKYLITNNKQILIGNLSTKKISSNKTGNLPDMSKRVGSSMSLYKFKQRLEYKCGINKTKYKEIDESYTSKTCSNCGNFKKDLGTNKIYKCNKCGMKIDRDINGSRCILINGIK